MVKRVFFDCFGSNFSRLSIPVTGYRHTLPNLGMTGSKTHCGMDPVSVRGVNQDPVFRYYRTGMDSREMLYPQGRRRRRSRADGARRSIFMDPGSRHFQTWRCNKSHDDDFKLVRTYKNRSSKRTPFSNFFRSEILWPPKKS